MLKRCVLMILFTVGCLVQTAYALETVRLVVLPFKINAHKDLAYLETEIPLAMEKHLEANGAVIIKPPPQSDGIWKDRDISIDAVRDLCRDNGASHVIWGSMTRIGQQYSIDARLLQLSDLAGSHSFFATGNGIENLPKTIKKLLVDMSANLFKREKIAKVIVTGNNRIEADAIKKKIKTTPGDGFLPKSLSEDLKSVYSMGYFEDIRIEAEEGPEGKTIIFHVKEKPTIRKITFRGNKAYDSKEILEVIDVRTGSVLSNFKLRNDDAGIKELFKEKKYYNVQVTHKIEELENNQCDIEFVIEEGIKLSIGDILFQGNTAFSSKKLKRLMKTKEKGFFSFITSSGELNEEDLKLDMAKLAAFYKNNGYVNVRMEEPLIEYKKEAIDITIKIGEGPRFKVGTVEISGELITSKEELVKKLKLPEEDFYNHQVVINDKIMLSDVYTDQGYAYVDVMPRIEQNLEDLVININFNITKGKQVYFEKIIITGNTKTRDKVIRRELKVYEQELFSGIQLGKSARNLYRLDFFEDINIDPVKGSADDKMILNVGVTEKSTGVFSIGGGYSSVEKFYVMGSVSQRNLFGRGQSLNFKGQLGGTTRKFSLNFTEPWLFDIPLLAGIDLYKRETDYTIYDKKSTGGSLRTGYLIFDYTRAYLSYNYEISELFNIDETASKSIKELDGENVTSSFTGSVRYDSRDRIFNPSEGQNHRISVEYAGLGGDINFLKYLGEVGVYFPLYKGLTGFVHGEGGFVKELPDGLLPDYERFYLGGINSLRGFKWREVGTLDEDGAKIGGEKYIQLNIEVIVPLFEDAGIVGLLFYDMGNVFKKEESINFEGLRQTAGFGFRWYSPMGPLRLEYGYILDQKTGEDDNGRWEFSMGVRF